MRQTSNDNSRTHLSESPKNTGSYSVSQIVPEGHICNNGDTESANNNCPTSVSILMIHMVNLMIKQYPKDEDGRNGEPVSHTQLQPPHDVMRHNPGDKIQGNSDSGHGDQKKGQGRGSSDGPVSAVPIFDARAGSTRAFRRW
jgi:hypothetical protein